jgi:hypothetical protein
MNGDIGKTTRGNDRVVVELGVWVTVYPAREPGDRWRAVWYENGRRRPHRLFQSTFTFPPMAGSIGGQAGASPHWQQTISDAFGSLRAAAGYSPGVSRQQSPGSRLSRSCREPRR